MRIRDICWNLAGLSLPLLVAVFTVPQLIATLGNERFGLLALSWGLIGYAGALDLGIGRALTQMVAFHRGENSVELDFSVLETARRITLVSGAIGGALITLLAIFFSPSWVSVQETPTQEIRYAMLLMALALPAQAMSATYRGLNEAYQNFKGVSLIRIGLGVINFGGPFVVSFHTDNVAALVGTIAVSRIAGLVIFRRLALSCLGTGISGAAGYSKVIARRLFAFGRWVTLSGVISPILVQADRFVIGAVISVAAVTTYVIPYEVVTKSLIVVGAVSSVAFPALSGLVKGPSDVWRRYFRRWLMIVSVTMALVCVVLAAILPLLLSVWLGESLNQLSVTLGQILCLGVFANSIGSMFYALLHALGRSDVTARLHLVELPLFLLGLFLAIQNYGLLGAAWAWVARMVFDTAILGWLARVRNA